MKLQTFISSLLSLEYFNSLNILYLKTAPNNFEVFQNTANIPRIILYLPQNSPDVDLTFHKYFFNSHTFSIVVLNTKIGFKNSPYLMSFLFFQGYSKLLVIFEDNIDFESAQDVFIQWGILNFIFISAQDFENTQEFYTFRKFPAFKVIKNKYSDSLESPFFDHAKNLHKYAISSACPNDIPNCMSDDSKDYGGLMLNILIDFYSFVNSTLNISTEQNLKVVGFENYRGFDIYAWTAFAPTTENFEEDYLAFEMSSYPLDFLHIFIVVPSPNPIQASLYPVKPFTFEVWIAIACVILYSTVLIKLSMIDDLEFGDHFTRMLRLAFAQSIQLQHNHPILSLFYTLNMIFGFVISLWYGAILGSYMSTFLNEKPINSFDDIKAHGLEIIYPNFKENNKSFEDVPMIWENMDMFTLKPLEEASILFNTMDDSFAYLEDSNHWYNFMIPQMNYFNDVRLRRFDLNIGTSFLKFNFNVFSFYKNQFNRLIFLLKDVGLYKHYADMVFTHNLKHKFVNYSHFSPKSNIRVLRMNFFYYVFGGWSTGIGIGILVFVTEILCSRGLRRMIFNKLK